MDQTPLPPIQPVRRQKLSEQVSDRLQELMLTSQLKPGDVLPSERELMSMLGVGRTSIREAFVSLSRMGLVEVRNGERARVARPSAVNVIDGLYGPVRHFLTQQGAADELRQARAMFEAMLARYAADHAAPEDVQRLSAALEANEQATDDIDEFTETDVAFHLAIAQVPGNSIFLALHHALAGWLAEQRTVSLRAAGAMEAAYAAHQAIFAAIESGDADQAEHAMSAHLKEVEQFYRTADVQGQEEINARRHGDVRD